MIKRGIAAFLIGGTLLFCGSASAEQQYEDAAVTVASSWLAVVDAGSYDQSWTQAATYFQSAVNREQWHQAMKSVRQPLGDTVSRAVMRATYTTELPGAPDGEYVVIQFDTSFENKRNAVETVTPMRDADGTWRVAGYFIK